MTEPQSASSTDYNGAVVDSTAAQPGSGSQPPATPRWVKITGAVLALIVLAVVVKLVFGGGVSHGPGMHGGLGTTTSGTAPSTLAGATAVALSGL